MLERKSRKSKRKLEKMTIDELNRIRSEEIRLIHSNLRKLKAVGESFQMSVTRASENETKIDKLIEKFMHHERVAQFAQRRKFFLDVFISNLEHSSDHTS
ncbi:Oidioi.mRNA.OKI2018_I69.XSR.g16975.t1.cds [Oikopleura dioica]|uniref:Oidioi.mRNA.OKI2018_I69.XSR.g16975.t1.cds n=1 Tax=Oikopleura dioica TaxID=34765 RepID=A0ABN7SMZ0_OIKDI|nr:Oidioi.mRNA.OKI2018_I69.XSR.g16975.t1.cds [Oikopleura dioica]